MIEREVSLLPSPDAILLALVSVLVVVTGWLVAQILLARDTSQKLKDHVAECDKRQEWTMRHITSIEKKLEDIDAKVDEQLWRKQRRWF